MTYHGITHTTKRYDPPQMNGDAVNVTVKIEVEGADGDEALALADCLYNAAEDTHRAFMGEGRDD